MTAPVTIAPADWELSSFDPGNGLPVVQQAGTYIADQTVLNNVLAAAAQSRVVIEFRSGPGQEGSPSDADLVTQAELEAAIEAALATISGSSLAVEAVSDRGASGGVGTAVVLDDPTQGGATVVRLKATAGTSCAITLPPAPDHGSVGMTLALIRAGDGTGAFTWSTPISWLDTGAPPVLASGASAITVVAVFTLEGAWFGFAGAGGSAVTVGAAGSGSANALSANDPTTTNARTPVIHDDYKHTEIFRPSGIQVISLSRHRATISTNLSPLASGKEYMVAVPVKAGTVISTLGFVSGSTAAGTPTNWWFTLRDANLNLLRVTDDGTTTAWPANTAKERTLATSYTMPADGLLYFGMVMVATTVINLQGVGSSNVVANVLGAPYPAMLGDSGLTTPGAMTLGSAPASPTAGGGAAIALAYAK